MPRFYLRNYQKVSAKPSLGPNDLRDTNRHSLAVKLMLLFGGIICISTSFLLPVREIWSAGLLSIGVAIVTSTVVSYIDSIFGTDVVTHLTGIQQQLNTRLDGIQECIPASEMFSEGLSAIYLQSKDCPALANLSSARHIDMLHNAGGYTFRHYKADIVHAIRDKGCHVRILLSDPADPIWNNAAINDILAPFQPADQPIRKLIESSEILIEAIIEELKATAGDAAGSLEVKRFPGITPSNLIIVDSTIARHTPHLMYHHTEEVPVFEITGERGHLLQKYRESFDTIWKWKTSIRADHLCYNVVVRAQKTA